MPETVWSGGTVVCRWCQHELIWAEKIEMWLSVPAHVGACPEREEVKPHAAGGGWTTEVEVTWQPHEPMNGDVPIDTDDLEVVERWLEQGA